jgi:hypothetical protein
VITLEGVYEEPRRRPMTNSKLGGWLLVALAIVGLAVAVPAVSAHGTDTAADDAPPYNGTADDWAAWMEAHVTDHMGPGSASGWSRTWV